MALFLAMFAVAWEPGLVTGWQWRLAIGLPVVAGGIAVSFGRFASRTPADQRTSFWAYRQFNWMLAVLAAGMIWALVSVIG